MWKGVLAILIALVVIGAVIGVWYVWKHEKDTKAKNARADEAHLVSSGTAVEVTARDLVRAFAENKVAAIRDFQGEIVAVTGKVQSVRSERDGDKELPYVVLDAGSLGAVAAIFSGPWSGELDVIARLRPGDRFTAKCLVVSYDDVLQTVYMRTCRSL